MLTGGWTAAIPHTTAGYVLTFLPIALLILPEVGSITVGGLKVEMRKTQDEVSKLGAQIQQLQILQATAAASEKAADTADDVPSAAVDAFLI